MRKMIPLFGLLLSVLLAAPAYAQDFDPYAQDVDPSAQDVDPYAQDFDKGVDAFKRGDFATAMREWLPLAEQDVAEAQHNIGMIYRKGLGVPQDYVKARQWFEKAAEQGYDPAQLHMAFLYRQGWGVPQDYAAAAEWYRKAALRGNVEGQYNLGLFYWSGTGVSRNLIQAYVWSSLAAQLYPPGRLRDDAISNRDGAYSAMTATWQREAAEGEAAFRLGWAYHVGQGTEANPDEALKFYCRSAELGFDVAFYTLVFLMGKKPEHRAAVTAVAVKGMDPLEFANGIKLKARQLGKVDRQISLFSSMTADWCRSLP